MSSKCTYGGKFVLHNHHLHAVHSLSYYWERLFLFFLNVHREAVPVMQKEGKGSIVFVSSGAGVASYIGYSAYAPTKWALRGLADTLRNELLADNIKVGGVF